MASSSYSCVVLLGLGLAGSVWGAGAGPSDKTACVQFDAIIELNAPICRTHVVLFARYWVSPRSYRVAVVWAEPHAGSLNFPIYPPTLSVASDPNRFTISHQFQHLYDGAFGKPLGARGPFRHRFNSYSLSDAWFAEQEALALRVYAGDIEGLPKNDGRDEEQVFDVSRTGDNARCERDIAQIKVRTARSRLDGLDLLDAKGRLLKGLGYEYASEQEESPLLKERVFLPEYPITVGFGGGGPTITIAGETRRYSELETVHHEGGRRCIVDYGAQTIAGRTLSLPARITVYSGDQQHVLRSVRLHNFIEREAAAAQIEIEARQYSAFEPDDMNCRELLLEYWLRNPQDIPPADVNTLRQLRAYFAGTATTPASAGQELKRINTLLQLDWMLGDPDQLERDFSAYLSLLGANHLDRMILFGGQNAVETTARWGQFDAADRLLRLWLDSAVSQHDIASILEFAAASRAKGRFWTVARLMDVVLKDPCVRAGERFTAQALHCVALARIHEMIRDPNHAGRTELDIAQTRWVLAHAGGENLLPEIEASLKAARQVYAAVDQHTRQHQTLKRELDVIEQNILGNRSAHDGAETAEDN